MKKVYNVVLLLILFYGNQNIIAQPNINFRITDFYPVSINDSDFVELFSNLGRFNLATMQLNEYLADYIVKYIDVVSDPTESYAVINLEEKENLVYDLKTDLVIGEQILEWHNLIAVLYSQVYNNLYVFSHDEIEDFSVMLSVYNLNTKQIVSTTGLSAYAGSINYLCHPEPDIFFSKDEKYIYISTNDTTTFAEQIWKFSLETNSIVSKRNLSEFGYSNMFGYSMSFGSGGMGIICSYNEYNEPTRHLYYNIYDFDSNQSTGFIHRNNVDNEYYFTNNGKYLVFISSVWGDTSTPSHHTGYTEIYDTETSQLLKTFNLPPNGVVYTFDNYPNNLYYVIDIEKPTRQIYTLKIDSIFNELDISSLTPVTTNVNSSPFTITVKGKGFDTVSTVYFNGQSKTTNFVSDSVVTAEILASDVSIAGTFPVWVKDEWAVSDTLQFMVQASSPNLLVNLKSSQGVLLTTGSLQYYEGSWKYAVNNGDGTFTVTTNLNTVSLRMAYEYGSQTVANITAHNNTYTFQTVNAAVQLKNSLGNLIDAGTVQYYSGAWRNFGTTTNGVANKELLPINYNFRMAYEFASVDKQQNLSVDPTVVFQTVNAAVQLKNSLGNLIDAGTVQYYSGAWRNFGTTTNGVANKELLPINYSFRMAYEYASVDKQQNLSVDPTVVFQTVSTAVQLKNSLGNLIDAGTVQYYSGAWRTFGTTTNGVANKELLPINYSFRMAYEFASIDKQQNLSVDPTVVFQTVNATVQLINSLGNLIDAGTVQYYSGAWRNFGTTTNGVANKELLPINYNFRMAYEFASIDKQQNLSVNPTVVFQTVNAAVQLKNSLGNLIDAGTVQYYSGAWRSFGATTNGVATKELLPINYSFRMAYEFASIDKQQNLSVNPTVVFQTVNAAVQLKNSLGNLIDAGTVQYYSGAWRNFGATTNGVATKELLPINYSFRMAYEYVSNDKQQNLNTNPVVNFATVLCSVKVSNATNQPLNNANVKYYAGAWRDLGITNAEGITIKELLPANLSFRASAGSVSKDKQQDITSNNLVEINLNTP
jgi:hypothetical protein